MKELARTRKKSKTLNTKFDRSASLRLLLLPQPLSSSSSSWERERDSMSANCEREEEKISSSHLAPVKQQQQWNRFISHCTHTFAWKSIRVQCGDSSSSSSSSYQCFVTGDYLSLCCCWLVKQVHTDRQTGRHIPINQPITAPPPPTLLLCTQCLMKTQPVSVDTLWKCIP